MAHSATLFKLDWNWLGAHEIERELSSYCFTTAILHTVLLYRSNTGSSSTMFRPTTTLAYDPCADSVYQRESRTLSNGSFRFPERGFFYSNCFRKIWNISHEPAFSGRVRLLVLSNRNAQLFSTAVLYPVLCER